MPTYAYQCASCSHELEAFQNISDAPLSVCPSCGKNSLQRGIGGGQLLMTRSSNKSASPQPATSCCPCGKSKCG